MAEMEVELVLAPPVITWRGGHSGGRGEVGVSWLGWESKGKGTEASTATVWDRGRGREGTF